MATAQSERMAEIVRRLESGESLESIAKSQGVSRERIRQILKRAELGPLGYARYLREQQTYIEERKAMQSHEDDKRAKRWAARAH